MRLTSPAVRTPLSCIMIRWRLLERTMLSADDGHILMDTQILGKRIIVMISMNRFRSLDEICCSYTFSHSYKLHTMAAPGQKRSNWLQNQNDCLILKADVQVDIITFCNRPKADRQQPSSQAIMEHIGIVRLCIIFLLRCLDIPRHGFYRPRFTMTGSASANKR